MVFFLTRSRAAKRLGQNGAPTHQKALETTREKERLAKSSVFLEPSLHLKGELCSIENVVDLLHNNLFLVPVDGRQYQQGSRS